MSKFLYFKIIAYKFRQHKNPYEAKINILSRPKDMKLFALSNKVHSDNRNI